ncbi:DUF192 domain-containing protein [Flavobacteriaceae bacterium TP-CH-4]|uniref:DUF192 domain-containing protein n=1 Tax=Pelagihabitans pacificus TaxID=2696054 RepID=A0A967AUS4_9FLAO|nr:DUF192 domain-containing protein [Pelagihabitans pacificus]NHF57972.1 DUF192 domain-containing protein [Pelagihabitans pacificus]
MIRILKFSTLLLLGCFLFVSCKDEPKKTIKTEEVVFKKEGELSIFKQRTDSLITTLDIEIADNDYETQTGLMYRSGMEKNQGMLFVFEGEAMHAFYMKNTEFPLDLLFIKEDLTLASFQENAQPFDEKGLSSKVPVKYVLEVNAGLVRQWGLEIGDRIEYRKR